MKYDLEIDVTKIQKDRLVTKEYTNKNGEVVKQTLLKATVIINQDEVIGDYDNRTFKKRGFVTETGKKEDNTNILGSVYETIWKTDDIKSEMEGEIQDIPF